MNDSKQMVPFPGVIDVKQLETEARYTNARIAVDLGYKHAVVLLQKSFTGDVKDLSNQLTQLVGVARALGEIIKYDLNKTLETLNGNNHVTPQLPS